MLENIRSKRLPVTAEVAVEDRPGADTSGPEGDSAPSREVESCWQQDFRP